jgi:predicted NBD/HSP70 family sugar kinase
MAFGQLIDQRKLNKRNHVVDLIRDHGPLSKARVRQLSGYSMDTLISLFKWLEDEGYVLPIRQPELADPAKAKGRPAELYGLDAERELYLGTTFNQSGIFSAIVSFSGAVLDVQRDDLPVLEDQASLESAFARHLLGFLARNSGRIPRLRRVGLALPGQSDPERAVLLHYGLMPFLKDLDLGGILRRHLGGIPLSCRHNVAGLARELLSDRSLSKGFPRILYVSARAGAAHALIQDGKVLLDDGEMGHIRVRESERLCECGRIGCLDTVFSARELMRLFPDRSRDEIALALAKEGPDQSGEARRSIETAFRAFCEALLDLCASFSPDLVLLSGEIFSILPDPAAWIRAWLGEMIDLDKPPAWFPREFMYRETGSEAAAIGLCYSLIEEDWVWQAD